MKKCLFFGVSLTAGLMAGSAYAQPDTVCGWIGPTNCSGDSGYIEISNYHTQGEHSLNFKMYHVNNWFDTTDRDSSGHADFTKGFGGIEKPDSIYIDLACDTSLTNMEFCFGWIHICKDTLWKCCGYLAPGHNNGEWFTLELGSDLLSMGMLVVSGDTISDNSPAPGCIDSLMFQFVQYGYMEGDTIRRSAVVYIDNLRFWYAGNDTLVDEMGDQTGIEELQPSSGQFILHLHPNPFSNSTSITYQVTKKSKVKIEIYDILGRKRLSLVNEEKQPGIYTIVFDGRNTEGRELPVGIYFCRLITECDALTRKMILLR